MPIEGWVTSTALILCVYLIMLLFLAVLQLIDNIIAHVIVFVLAALFGGFFIHYLYSDYQKTELKEENAIKQSLFIWDIMNEEESLNYGMLKKENFLIENEYYFYIEVPSLQELNNNEKLKQELESYIKQLNSSTIDIFDRHFKTDAYIYFKNDKDVFYSIKNINKSISGDYKIIKEERDNYKVHNLKNKNIQKILIENHSEIINKFTENGFNVLKDIKKYKDEEDYLTINLIAEKELSRIEYDKILNIFGQYRDFELNLRILNDKNEEISYHSSDEILNEIDNMN